MVRRNRWNKELLSICWLFIKKVFYVLEAVIVVLAGGGAALLWSSAMWMFKTWPKLRMDELVYQLNAPMDGTNLSMVEDYIQYCIPITFVVIISLILMMVFIRGKQYYHKIGIAIVILALGVLLGTAGYTANRLDIKNYSENKGEYSAFIDDNYVDPKDVEIVFPERKRNLIYIFLESMEITYTDKQDGGGFTEDYIPELTLLAQQHEDFSGEDQKLNGGHVMPSTTWTVAGMFGQSSGLPLKVPVDANDMGKQASFLPRVTAIGDILESADYNQTLLIGSEAVFGGRKQMYTDHGDFAIKDYNYAIEQEKIPSDYRVWWGYEDKKLFDFAKEELLELSTQDKPFNLTMLTVDTHFEDGYYCDICRDLHDGDIYANVLSCASKQVAGFVEWIQQQDFYENTTIVISGDHLTMDSDFCIEVDKDPEYTRKTYTNYINPATQAEKPELRREYTTFDNFPTTLGALGVTIEGNRLGLGTNLFSGEYTLLEQYGTNRMKTELKKKSKLMEEFSSDVVQQEEMETAEEFPSAVLTADEYDYTTGILPLYVREIDDKGKGISAVNVAVWVDDDQSDIQWMQAESMGDGTYLMNISVPDFEYKVGEYKIDAYMVDDQGTQHLLGSTVGHVE